MRIPYTHLMAVALLAACDEGSRTQGTVQYIYIAPLSANAIHGVAVRP